MPRRAALLSGNIIPAQGKRRGPGSAASGCAQQVLRPQINDAAIRLPDLAGHRSGAGERGRLLRRAGPAYGTRGRGAGFRPPQYCCLGEGDAAGALDAIVVTASGCGTTVKDYGHMLAQDRHMPRGQSASARWPRTSRRSWSTSSDIGAPIGLVGHSRRLSLRLLDATRPAYQRAAAPVCCAKPGFSIAEIGEGHICCGSAGTYNILAAGDRERIARAQARQYRRDHGPIAWPPAISVASRNSADRDAPPVVHTVELLDWAYGGKCPAEIAHLQDAHAFHVGQFRREAGGLNRHRHGGGSDADTSPARSVGPLPNLERSLQLVGVLRWSRLFGQFFRLDKWTACRG